MVFNRHRELEGRHAILSPSKYYWIGYSDEKLTEWLQHYKAMSEGVETHDFARRCIERGVKLSKRKKTLNMYVNDAISYGLTPEQVLYYTPNCFGTADAIGVTDDDLYIFDLKTGETRADMRQLEIYAGLFSLEYPREWSNIGHVYLRIYQSNNIREVEEAKEEIDAVAARIVEANAILDDMPFSQNH